MKILVFALFSFNCYSLVYNQSVYERANRECLKEDSYSECFQNYLDDYSNIVESKDNYTNCSRKEGTDISECLEKTDEFENVFNDKTNIAIYNSCLENDKEYCEEILSD